MTKNLVLAMIVASATSALAQPAPPTPPPQGTPATADKEAEAKAHYDKGISHYNLGEFDPAITEFKAAYAISSKPGLLFNVAQSYRLKKDYEQALYFYQTYLRLKPDAPNRQDVEDRMKEMQDAIEEQKKIGEKKPIGTMTPEGGTTTTTTTAPNGTTTTTTTTAGPTTTDDGGVKAQSLLTAGYVTGGAGAALLITGVIFGSMARSAEKDLNNLSSDHGTWTPEQQDKYDTGKRNNTIAIVSFIAGGAALATGATLFVLGTMKKSKTTVAINPTAHGTTFAVGWSF
ncbi:MAG TPA: tetratricopeptide repeat protein [Kofleriaceae bacterium]|nr:tetratricopeptide repeat protein [Kofleriaceae bacterium]